MKGRDWRRLAFVLVATSMGLGIAELGLRVAGYGAPGDRPDPFRGYSTHHPVFVKAERAGDGWQMNTSAFATGMNKEGFFYPKPRGTVRIFMLGGSSVAGLYLRRHESMARQLKKALSKRHPGLKIEVLNAGQEGKSSHTLATTVKELVRYDPDLLVVYSGHNDWPNTRWDAEFIQPEPGTRLRMLLDRIRLYVALRELVEPGGETTPGVNDDRSAMPGFDTPPGGEVQQGEWDEVELRFEENIEAMIEIARSGGASVVLCTVVSNPYSPPAGCRVDGAAADPYSEACQHFVKGKNLLQQGEKLLARTELDLALEQDPVPTRAGNRLNEVLRAVASRRGVALVDLSEVLDSGFEMFRGQPLFVDNVHPSAVGSKLMVEAIADRVLDEGLLQAGSVQELDGRL